MVNRLRRRLTEELRQRGHHPAFRIGPPLWAEEQQRELERLLDGLAEPSERPVADEPTLVAVGTSLWRARHRLAQPSDPPKRARQAARHLADTERALGAVGLVIQDHTGEPYHSGLSLEVIAMVDDAGVSGETVVETIRPSIYLAGKQIQMGQVVVGFPPEPGSSKENPGA